MVLAAIGMCLPLSAIAQTSPPAGTEVPADDPELDRLFERMLREPANLDVMFQYAQRAVEIGNYDAAVGTLSRMLLFNPDLPRVRLELGALYFQMGSYEAARTYLTQALEAKDMPPEIRERANILLAEIDRRTARSILTGSLTVGARWQQNANSGPGSAQVRALGQDATLSNEFLRRSDWNAFGLASFQHTYNPMVVSGDVLESTAVLYGTRQNELKTLNVALMEVTTGPRFALGDSGPGKATLRPYLLANIVGLGDVRYYHSFGGGISLTQEFGPRVLGEVLLERRDKYFNNSEARPFAKDQTGDENSVFVSARIQTSADTLIAAGVGLSGDNAREEFRANTQYLASASFTYFFDPDFWTTTQPWTVSLSVARLATNYNGPDPSVDPEVDRKDREWRFGVLGTAPITDSLSVLAQAQRFNVSSNLPNFEYNNWALTGGLSWRF
ncbi:MAG TPA: tetratricopeptide repeat protein [Alphaproteobacteria bacterium]|nr:tetratricopeptide repeat protein [Alphaproteobacteria bacterium]